MRVLAYVRVSTARQQAEGVSLDAQKQAIAAEIEKRDGWALGTTVLDTASASTLNRRPTLIRALERLDTGELDVLMVSRLDRLSRSMGDFAGLMDRAHKNGWTIVCLDPPVDLSTPFGRAMAGMAAVFAQLERELIGQRTREGIQAQKEAGTYRPPVSHVDPDTVQIMVRARGRKRSYRHICDQLDAEGIPAPRGGLWQPSTVQRILERQS